VLVEELTGKRQKYTYIHQNRIGDHICYYSDLRKMREHYRRWDISVSLEEIIGDIVSAWHKRLAP
jgi:CDP-paratose 2-epimerase